MFTDASSSVNDAKCGCPGCLIKKQLDVNTASTVDATKLANALMPLFQGYDVSVVKKADGMFSVTLKIDSTAVAPMNSDGSQQQPMSIANVPTDSSLISQASKSDLVVSASVAQPTEVLSDPDPTSSSASSTFVALLISSIIVLVHL